MAKTKNEDDLNRIAYEIQAYQQQGQLMQQQLASVQDTINEIGAAQGTLKSIGDTKDEEVLLPLGAGTHIQAKITDSEKVLIDIGSDVIAEKPISEAAQILEDRRARLEQTRDKFQNNIIEISKKIQQLDAEAKKLINP